MRLLRCAVLLLLPASPAFAQSVLRGRVVQDSTLHPIEHADVLQSGAVVARTAADGSFRLLVSRRGEVTLGVRRLGYTPTSVKVDVQADSSGTIEIELKPVWMRLDSITVTERALAAVGWRRDFEARRAHGIGRFLDDSEIAKISESATLASILRRWHINILTGRRGEQTATTARGPTRIGLAPCPLQIYVDGIPVKGLDLRHVNMAEIGGIEYYAGGAQTPVEFERLDASCGVLILWTR